MECDLMLTVKAHDSLHLWGASSQKTDTEQIVYQMHWDSAQRRHGLARACYHIRMDQKSCDTREAAPLQGREGGGSPVLGGYKCRQGQHGGSPLQPGAAWCPSSLYSTERLLSTVLRPHCRERCWPKASWLETESVMSLMSPWGWGSDPLTHTQFWSVHSKGRRRQWHIC